MVGSGIRKKPIPDPGSGGQKGTGSQIRIRNTGNKGIKLDFWMFNILKNNFPGTLKVILYKMNWTYFWVKFNLHIYKTVKDFQIPFLPDIPFAN
jgi:hypothetical protein